MKQSVSLKTQISSKLQTILGYYVVATALLLFLLAVGSIGMFHLRQLEQYVALVTTKLSTELSARLREVDSMGNSSIVWTGMTDSAGREAYLEPLLERINRTPNHQIDLLDYRGRDYIVSKKSSAQARLTPEVIEQAIASSTAQAELQATPHGTVLKMALPITAPFADGLLGLMLSSINLDQELESLGLPNDVQVRYSLQVSPGDKDPPFWRARVAQVPVRAGPFEVPLQVEVGQPVGGRLLLALLAVLLLLLSGYSLFRTLSQWAEHFSGLLTDRIDRLVQLTARAAAHGDAPVEQDSVGDEISAMFDALQSIVMRQRSINQKLLVSSRVFETAGEAILITDPDGLIADVNAALLRITGYQREQIMGKPAGLLYRQQAEGSSGNNDIGQALRQTGEWRGETHVITHDQQPIPVMMAVSSLFDEHHNNLGNVAIISDIREVKRVEARLRELIYEDQLTGLPNYRAFTEFIERKVAGASGAQGEGRSRFALLFIDLDHLKQINDTYGHELGDEVIVQFARHLQDRLPQPHFLCRRSGDEFIAVLDIDEDSATLKARLQAALPSHLHEVSLAAGMHVQASFSMGAAAYPEHANNVKDLLVLADSALLFSKEAGRSRVTWLNAHIVSRIQRRLTLEVRLQEALRERRIVPHYQPEVDLRDGQITGFEALARWHDPELGDVSPAEFIPIAEDKGLIDLITEIMLEKVMHDLPAIRSRFPQAQLSFNASPQLLADQRMLRLLASHQLETTVGLAGLTLEVTESELMLGMEDASEQLAAIIGMGVQIALDDFGKAYSSLSRLSELPIHKLKIDGSFVAALDDEGHVKVVNSIMALAGTLKLEVTAEGVETAQQRSMLLDMGCHKAQGYMFARPMPLAQLLALPMHLPVAPKALPQASA